MIVDRITFTGADNNTSLLDLVNLSAICPYVEWGILFSKSRDGQPRYPSLDKIRSFSNLGIKLSAHLCGWYAKDVLENGNFKSIERLDGFQRVQINYNFSTSKGWDLAKFWRWIEKNPERAIIFQYNKSNAHPLEFLYGQDLPQNIHFLYDSSGGRGTVISEIKPPFKNQYTGYSGGINPKNVQNIFNKILDHPSQDNVWLDMESGVRTNDEFDIDKCVKVLDTLSFNSKSPELIKGGGK